MDISYSRRDINPELSFERQELAAFLDKHHLRCDDDIEFAAAFVDDDTDEILGCGCCSGNILKCFAVDERLRGQNLMGQIISILVNNRFAAGYSRLFVYTKPENQTLFGGAGFFTVAATDRVAMMENRPKGPESFVASVKRDAPEGALIGAAVMNCNPFTLGHRHLVEYAAANCDLLYLFVVEEDRSVFPFADRLRLVQEGTADLPNVRVCAGGPYMISSATFPTYFLKKDDDAVAIQAKLDLTIFAEKIAPPLDIRRRFVGQEPACPVTSKYNGVMKQLLPEHGIEVCEIPRKETEAGVIISASTVRDCLDGKRPELDLRAFVPETTYSYLMQRK
ncbi:MAG: [Firmicutes bacterium]|nr:[citrate (pro-3S)-lyase] ligase [Bacillota bacterium]